MEMNTGHTCMTSLCGDGDNNHADVIFSTAIERGLDQILANLGWTGHRPADDPLDVGVAHHVPEPIGTQQELIVGLQGLDKRIYFYTGFFAQTAINLVALGMRINIDW